MKTILLLALVLFGCTEKTNQSEKIIKEVVPGTLRIDEYPAAKSYLEDEVTECGAGVIEGAKDASGVALPNKCGHTIQVDEEFLRNHQFRTGLLHDPEWPYQKGVTFFEPIEAAVPESFDIRDEMRGGLPSLRKQAWNDCWAWATHHGVELARAVHDKKAVDHSVQSVIDCSGKGTAASGGYMSAVDFTINRGLPYEVDYPYNGKDNRCKLTSTELQKGFDGKIISAPYIGSSYGFSRFHRGNWEGTKVKNMMAAIYQWKAPLVVTVSAYSQSANSNGPVTSIGAVNSGGNHMVTITGWGMHGGKRIANVWNSWGSSHGNGGTTPNGVKTPGVSSIVWEAGDGKLNRGLGVSARIIQYKAPCTPPEISFEKNKYIVFQGGSVKVGKSQPEGVKCKWTPSEYVSNPESCETFVTPQKTTELHLEATSDCGKTTAMTVLELWGPTREKIGNTIVTPFGEVAYEE